MNTSFTFNNEQFNRLFPFYFIINRNLQVISAGQSLQKLIDFTQENNFNQLFIIPRPLTQIHSADDLIRLKNQLVVLESVLPSKIMLRGQFEYQPETEEIIFVGSPWFGSMEQVRENNLVIDDFARHDPLIDLLHVMKSHEITNEDLKQLITTINKQKNELKKANKAIHDIALFPMQNPDPLIRINFSGAILQLNPAAENLTDFEYENIKYTQEDFFNHISTIPEIKQERWIFEARSGNQYYSFVSKMLETEGYINIYGRNVTEQKKTEVEYERLSLVASANENGVIFTQLNGIINWANKGFYNLTGFTAEDALGKTPVELCLGPLTDLEAIKKGLDSFYKGMAFTTETIYYRKDRSWFWGRVTSQPVKNSDGEITQYFGIIEDITEAKEVQRKLKEYEERLKMALTNVGDNYWEHDFKTGKTIFSNPDNNVLGFNVDENADAATLWWERVYPDDKILLEENDKKYKAGLIDHHIFEYRMRHRDGSIRWVLDRGVVTELDEHKKPLRIIGTHIDITKQKELELELIKAKNTAEESTRVKEAFLANMSHEIRTPMNAIMGMANQLTKTSLDTDQQFYLNNIQSATDNLLIIINDILDFSKIEAGQLTIEKIGFEPKLLVARAMQVMLYKAEEKGLALTNRQCDEKMAPVLLGDPYRLNQILLNLISNAIKFTEKGSIDISCRLVEEDKLQQLIEVTVRDTGIGMAPDFVKNIFQKFKQEDESVTRRFGGTGLGMSICKDLVELMGGTIRVDSKKGKGTSVSFTIPFEKGTSDNLPLKVLEKTNTAILSGKRILVTDDNEMNRLVASTILKNFGAIIEEANNGAEALHKVKQQAFDIVLMDVQMPVMDGVEATEIIRTTISKELPVIALTAFVIKGDKEKFLKAGMNDYLSKPFDENQLLAILSKWLGKKERIAKKDPKIKTAELYDLSGLQNIAKGNQDFINKMIQLFIEQGPASVNEIKEAYAAKDYLKVKKTAHRMKPSIDNMGILSLKYEIREIEKNAEIYQKSEQLDKLIYKIDSIINDVVNNLKPLIK